MKYLYVTFSVLSMFIILTDCNQGPKMKDDVLGRLLKENREALEPVLSDPDKYRLQILYTQIDRDAQNHPSFTSYSFGMNTTEYFYPASTVKFPVALLALERINDTDIEGLTKFTPMQIDSGYSGQTAVYSDSTAKNGKPSIAHYVKKVFLVSDNDAYNRLYEFIGQEKSVLGLRIKGFIDTKIIRRLSVDMTHRENRTTNPISFIKDGKVIYRKPLETSLIKYQIDMEDVKQGKGYYKDGELIHEPIDFTHSNYISIDDLQRILRTVLFPMGVSKQRHFNLTDDDYHFVYTYMSMYPRESDIEAYRDTTTYHDSYGKFLMFGDSKEPIPDHIRIFNKVGQAYGYLIDNAYVVDFKSRTEFMLTAVLQVNENEIYNDDNYEYDEIGLPFLARLGQIIYRYEQNRERRYTPDLSRFQLSYEGINK